MVTCNYETPCEVDLYMETYVLEDICFMIMFYNYLFRNKLHWAENVTNLFTFDMYIYGLLPIDIIEYGIKSQCVCVYLNNRFNRCIC